MSDRYADDIKRIVGVDKTKSALSQAVVREGIPGKRGIGYYTADKRSVQTASGNSGEGGTQIPPQPDDNQDTKIKSTGKSPDPRNPLSGIKEEGDNTFDVEDVLDGKAGPTFSSSINSGLGAFEGASGGTLDTLSGIVDCDTGKELEVHLVDDPPPPEGWQAWNMPPTDDDFIAGLYWRPNVTFTNPLTYGAQTLAACKNALIGETVGTGRTLKAVIASGDGDSEPGVAPGSEAWARYSYNETDDATFLTGFEQLSCLLPTDYTAQPFCSTTAPALEQEADGKMQLTFKNGAFSSNPYEATADKVPALEGQGTLSFLGFCFGESNSRSGVLRKAINGGFMLYETDPMDGTVIADGIVRVYNSSGRLAAATDAVGLKNYLPQNEN